METDPFFLTLPEGLPVRENMDDQAFNSMMARGYAQAINGDSYPIAEVFAELEEGIIS